MNLHRRVIQIFFHFKMKYEPLSWIKSFVKLWKSNCCLRWYLFCTLIINTWYNVADVELQCSCCRCCCRGFTKVEKISKEGSGSQLHFFHLSTSFNDRSSLTSRSFSCSSGILLFLLNNNYSNFIFKLLNSLLLVMRHLDATETQKDKKIWT